MILRPQKNFTIVRQIANHTDTGTYYVRAVIRNAYTDAIIATLNLDDKGGQRFTKNWQVPADPSGLGLEISIVTSVYTDSGYTTKSENYGDEENTHLIEEKGPIGGKGGGIDTATLRRIVKEELDKAKPEPIEIPEAPKYEMRWNDVLEAIRGVESKIKPPKEVDMTPVLGRIGNAIEAIQNKEVTPPTDIGPAIEQIQRLAEVTLQTLRQIVTIVQSTEDEISNRVVEKIGQDVGKKIEEVVKTATFTIAPSTAKMNMEPEVEEELPTIDITKLTQ